jgi:hypothetical protein
LNRAAKTAASALIRGLSKQTLRVWLISLCTTHFERKKPAKA